MSYDGDVRVGGIMEPKDSVTISNICDGNVRTFRVRDGQLSDAGLRHARSIGYGGPKFTGPAADAARESYEQQERYLDETW